MKKLILAPAVALAFTGLVAAPVAAAETPSTQSAQTKAEQAKAEKKEAAEKAAAKKKADAKKEAAEKAAAKKAADKKAAAKKAAAKKAADKKAADDKAAKDKKDGKKDESKKTPPPADNTKPTTPPKDNDDKGSDSKDENKGDEVKDINASLKVAASSVDAEQLADEGVKVTVTGLEKGDKLTTSGLSAPATTAIGSTATLVVTYNGEAEDLTRGSKALTVKVQREGVAAQNLRTEVVFTPFSAVDPIDASLKVDPEEITAEDLANEDKGVTVTVSGVKKGDKITDSLTGKSETAEADGDYKLHLWYDGPASDLEEDKLPFTVTIDREGTESETVDGTINVVDEVGDEDPVIDPKVKLGTDEITVEEFKKNGLPFTGTGFTPGSTVSVAGKAVSAQAAKAQADDEVVADEDGNVSGVVTAPASLEAGTIELTFTDTDSTQSAPAVTITVTEDDDDAVDPIDASLKVDPKKITAEDLANEDKGVTVTVSGVKKGDKVTDSLTGKSETADADGDYKLHLWYEGNPKNLEEGKLPFTVTIDREGTESQTLDGAINVVADEPEAPAEATLKVSPKSIEAADFANDKKGVTLSVENCEPGADVHFEVNPKGINVTAYENTVKADDEGRASVNVFGTSSNASAYVGAYTATATCGDDTMKDSFKVTEGANGGGDNGNGGGSGDNGNGGSELPRTGADLGGLATGALLLLVGGAAIAVTGRKNKFARTPFSF
ncbi:MULTISPECIES: hypothetical protein [unclassified Brevibacterium]|uniref:hypothetical protein n=1 Tax=unclassified Brevibacterium TaxID=2614124 RepID=UPI001E5162DE|nr:MULTISPECIES: hypothetical protein [unclassified Brevibacterium]MDK8434218.1 hypothetical protein [Brevibacterium sp. H-BE7]